jgi:hypothetical protein
LTWGDIWDDPDLRDIYARFHYHEPRLRKNTSDPFQGCRGLWKDESRIVANILTPPVPMDTDERHEWADGDGWKLEYHLYYAVFCILQDCGEF